MRVLLSAGGADVPHLLPGPVERAVHGVDAGMVRGHRVARVRRDPVLLGPSRVGQSRGVGADRSSFDPRILEHFLNTLV